MRKPWADKEVFRDQVWAAAQELAKGYPPDRPDWNRVQGYMAEMERAITGETFWGTPLPSENSDA